MKNNKSFINFIFILATASSLLLSGCEKLYEKRIKNKKTAILIKNETKINLEIAKAQTEKTLGLMFRKELCRNCGMIFIFDDEEEKTFWMKNTYIPLDIIFLSKDFKINKIFKNVERYNEKMSDDEIPKVSAKGKYVIEINAFLSDELKLKEGEKLKIKFE